MWNGLHILSKVLLTGVILTTPGTISAQTVGGETKLIHQLDGLSPGSLHGTSVARIDDINGDGVDDVIVGSPYANSGGLTENGSVTIFSGLSGTALLQLNGPQWNSFFGISVSSAGDINGDGVSDIIVGATGFRTSANILVGYAAVYSGSDGTEIYSWQGTGADQDFGHSVSSAGDVNQDGVPDILIGTPHAENGFPLAVRGAVDVFSGNDGTLLFHIDGLLSDERLGWAVSEFCDINNDGFDDFLAGAPATGGLGGPYSGSTMIFSGIDGSLLHQWHGEFGGDEFGASLAGMDDTNGDGIRDIIIGAPLARVGPFYNTFGKVYVYSGADFSLIHKWEGDPQFVSFGHSVSWTDDVTGDGFPECIVGRAQLFPLMARRGAAYLFSGMSGSLLHRWDGELGTSNLGCSVSGIGDINGDGFGNILLGANGYRTFISPHLGSTFALSFSPFITADTSSISTLGGGTVAINLNFPTTEAGNEYILLMSAHGTGPINYGVDIPLTLDNYLLDSASGIYPFSSSSGTHGTLDLSGKASASITLSPGAFSFATGRTFWLAAVTFPSGQLPTFSSIPLSIELLP